MILGSLRFFIVTHTVFSSVGAEMLTGGSVVAGWDQTERAGPKDDRQVTSWVLAKSTHETLDCHLLLFLCVHLLGSHFQGVVPILLCDVDRGCVVYPPTSNNRTGGNVVGCVFCSLGWSIHSGSTPLTTPYMCSTHVHVFPFSPNQRCADCHSSQSQPQTDSLQRAGTY